MSEETKRIRNKQLAARAVTVWLLVMGLMVAFSGGGMLFAKSPVWNSLAIWFTGLLGGWLVHAWQSGQLLGPRIAREVFAFQLVDEVGLPATGASPHAGIFFDINHLYFWADFLTQEGIDLSEYKIKIVRVQWPHHEDKALCRDDFIAEDGDK